MITVIAGGTGSIKLIRGLDFIINEDITIIANVGDNIEIFGLYICPDIDTTVYGLSKQLDVKRGWGIQNDTFNFLNSRKNLSEETWFQIGDMDLKMHIKRTNLIKNGLNLAKSTKILSNELGIKHNIIPASNNKIETRIITNDIEMHLQEFWVKNKGKHRITNVIYKGIENAKPAENVIESIKKSSKIIVAPGNPISSIGPTIFIKKIRDALTNTKAKKIVLSPIKNNQAISGPAGKMMKAKGYEVSILGLTEYYKDFMTDIIIDKIDKDKERNIEDMGKTVHISNIMMKNESDERRLAKEIIDIKE